MRGRALAAPQRRLSNSTRSSLSGCAALRRFSRIRPAPTRLRVPRGPAPGLPPPPPTRRRRAGRFRIGDLRLILSSLSQTLVKPAMQPPHKTAFPARIADPRDGGRTAGRRRRRGGRGGTCVAPDVVGVNLAMARQALGASGCAVTVRQLPAHGSYVTPASPDGRQLVGSPAPVAGDRSRAVTVWVKPLCAQPANPGPEATGAGSEPRADRADRRPLPPGRAAADEPALPRALPEAGTRHRLDCRRQGRSLAARCAPGTSGSSRWPPAATCSAARSRGRPRRTRVPTDGRHDRRAAARRG